MKLSTVFYLKSYMETHRYGIDYNFTSLFRQFFNNEIHNLNDMEHVGKEYLNFLFQFRNYLISKMSDEDSIDNLNQEILDIRAGLFGAFLPESNFIQRCYSNLIESISDKNTKLLDVGAGVVPISSMIMAEDGMKIEAMDNLLAPENLLKKYNLEGHNEYFTTDTDISKYDIVIGNRPCSAIPKIVENCANHNKGYFISLCDCDVSLYKDSKGRIARSWYDVLPQYDKKVKFYDGIAYNIDVSKRQLKRLVDDFNNVVGETNRSLLINSFFESIISDVVSDFINKRKSDNSEPGDE